MPSSGTALTTLGPYCVPDAAQIEQASSACPVEISIWMPMILPMFRKSESPLLTVKAGSVEVDEKERVSALEQHGLLFLQKPVTASIAASQCSSAFASR